MSPQGIILYGDYMKEKNKLELEIEKLNREVELLKRMDMKKDYLIQNEC